MPSIFVGDNDHSIQLLALMNEATQLYDNGATVTCEGVLSSLGGTSIGGLSFPVAMGYVNPSPDTVGGEAGGETVVESVSGFDITVTVGTTNALSLTAGRFLRVLHSGIFWVLNEDASGIAGATVVLHLEPVSWPIGSGQTEATARPTEAEGTVGEIVEILDGVYSATLDKALLTVKGTKYWAQVKAVSGLLDGEWLLPVKGAYRLS